MWIEATRRARRPSRPCPDSRADLGRGEPRMPRMRCERCGLVDSPLRTGEPSPDALRRNAVAAVRSTLTGLDHPIR